MSLGPVMMDIEGTRLNEEDKQLLRHPLIGGLIYFARNYESVEQITELSAAIRQERPDILIAVDQEGGRVQRFKEGFTRLPAMQQFLPLYRKNPEAAHVQHLVNDCGWLMAVELLAIGVDFSFAPVLDVDDMQCEAIASRSFSPKPEEVNLLAGEFIKGMNEAGMAATGKHFPGHGSVVGDSHQILPYDNRTFEQVSCHDLIPFQALSKQLNAIMPAHIVFSKVDDKPVGFSSFWLQKVLRQQLGFDGVIFSDDLTMEGAAFVGGYGQRAEAALTAGCDMVLVCNSREGVHIVLNHLSNHFVLQKGDSRLSSMQASQSWTHETLSKNKRYIKARALLKAIEGQ